MCLHCVFLSEDKTLSLLQNPSKRYESVLLFKVRGTFFCVLFSWMQESYSGPPLSFGILLWPLSRIVVALVPTVFVSQQAVKFLAPRTSDLHFLSDLRRNGANSTHDYWTRAHWKGQDDNVDPKTAICTNMTFITLDGWFKSSVFVS